MSARLVRVATVASLVLVLGFAFGASRALAAPALPSSDPFYAYTGATPLGQIAPGTVLKQRGVQIVVNGAPTPYPAQQVLYRTTGELGQPTVTVATIISPLTTAGTTKLVSYQTFYDALGSECDPSYTLQGGNPSYQDAQIDAALMEDYLNAGFTVVNADYEGESLDWAAGQESGEDTLDGIRAAENALNLPSSTEVGMVGYSGGSIATEWASELAPGYAPELHIIGAAEGGIPVDYAHNLTYINGDTDGWAGVIPAVLVGTARAFDLNLSQYLSAYGQQVVNQVSGECINDFAGSYNGLTVQQLLKPQYQNFLAVPTFASIINTLTMGTSSTHPASPLFMAVGNADGTGDDVMVAADVEALAHEYCTKGVPVTFTEYTGADHEEAIAPFETAALQFLENLFAGAPAPNGCASIGVGNSLALLPVAAAGSGGGRSAPGASCPVVTGSLHRKTLGLIHLGMTRAQARRAYSHSSNRGRRYEDFFCLTPVGVRVGYASPRLLGHLPRRQRSRYRGRIVWASTSDLHFAVEGVRPGTKVRVARRMIRHLSAPFTVGRNDWYLARMAGATAVLKVRHGVVQEIGIADLALTRTRAADSIFLRSFY
ncbi:MAG TPA: lipase family protein [Solirubrobacteraceae bacterium]|nr:lipase family protein [Solirubrobacteraceae bacterium]